MSVLWRLVLAVAIMCATCANSLQSHGLHSRRSALNARIIPETLGAGAALVVTNPLSVVKAEDFDSDEEEMEEGEEDNVFNVTTTVRPELAELIFPDQTKCDKVRDEDQAYTLALERAHADQPRLKKIVDDCNPESDVFWAKAQELGAAYKDDEKTNMCKKPKSFIPGKTNLPLETFCYGLFKPCVTAKPLAAKLLADIEVNQRKWWAQLRKLEKHRCGGGLVAEEEEEEEAAEEEEEEAATTTTTTTAAAAAEQEEEEAA